MTNEELRALFLLAGIPIKKEYELPNGYGAGMTSPWWLVSTEHGLIKIGWRKRVISIDWSETGVACSVTADDVTKEDHLVHAWTWGKAVDYLRELHLGLSRAAFKKAESERAPSAAPTDPQGREA